jgi:hypothetical protein
LVSNPENALLAGLGKSRRRTALGKAVGEILMVELLAKNSKLGADVEGEFS